MSNKLFTKKLQMLSKNRYVRNVSEKGITYTDEFKNIFITENEKVDIEATYIRSNV